MSLYSGFMYVQDASKVLGLPKGLMNQENFDGVEVVDSSASEDLRASKLLNSDSSQASTMFSPLMMTLLTMFEPEEVKSSVAISLIL